MAPISSTPPSAPLDVTVLPATGRAAAAAHWAAVEAALPDVPLACSWTWTNVWLDAFGADVQHRFLLASRAGEPVGAILLTRSPSRVPPVVGPRTIHLGTAGEPRGASVFVERNALLVRDDARAAFAAAVVAELDGDRGWDRWALDGFLAADAAALIAAGGDRTRTHARTDESPIADLDAATDGDVMTLYSGKRAKRLRYARKSYGPVEVHWAATPEEAHATLDELIALHEAHWQALGEEGAFADPRLRAFHRGIVDALIGDGRVVLIRVARPDGATAGCIYGFREGRRLIYYQSGMSASTDNRLRPGIVTLLAVMQACIERDVGIYDFLAPPSEYKLQLATGSEPLVWAQLDRTRPRVALEVALRRLRNGVRARRSAD